MKKLSMILSVLFFSIMITVPAFPLSYEFDLNGDEVWDNDDFLFMGQSIPVEIWLDNYSCPPDDLLIGVQLYVAFDTNYLEVVEAFPNDSDYGGPFDPSLSGFICRQSEPGICFLVASKFNYASVIGNRILLGTIILEATSPGITTIKAANKLGIDDFNDGFVADCSADNLGNPNPQSLYPDDAVAEISISNCVVESIYGEQSRSAETLRHYRNTVLRQTPEGRELIRLYYLWSPTIVRVMEGDEEFKEEVKEMIDGVLPMIGDGME